MKNHDVKLSFGRSSSVLNRSNHSKRTR